MPLRSAPQSPAPSSEPSGPSEHSAQSEQRLQTERLRAAASRPTSETFEEGHRGARLSTPSLCFRASRTASNLTNRRRLPHHRHQSPLRILPHRGRCCRCANLSLELGRSSQRLLLNCHPRQRTFHNVPMVLASARLAPLRSLDPGPQSAQSSLRSSLAPMLNPASSPLQRLLDILRPTLWLLALLADMWKTDYTALNCPVSSFAAAKDRCGQRHTCQRLSLPGWPAPSNSATFASSVSEASNPTPPSRCFQTAVLDRENG